MQGKGGSAMVVIGSVWDRTVEFISDNLSAVVPIALMGVFVPLSISTNLWPLASTVAPAERLLILSVILALAFWSLWGKLCVSALALDPHGGRAPASQISFRRLLPAIGILLVSFVVFLVAVSPIAIILGADGFDFAAGLSGHTTPLSDSARGLALVYLIILLSVVIWCVARLIVIYPTILMERRGLGVFRRSFRLTRGYTLPLVGLVILYIIVFFVATKATQYVFGAVLSLMFGSEGTVSLATILTSILVGVVDTGFTVLAMAFVTKLYLALRDARESIVNAR
jgi:hypothetical protein